MDPKDKFSFTQCLETEKKMKKACNLRYHKIKIFCL